jgi:hypothetical protein
MDRSYQQDDPPLPVAHSFRFKLLDNVLTQIDKAQNLLSCLGSAA